MKYTQPKGRVGIELTSDKKDIFITIRDDGIGIEKKNQQRIFDRFFRCDASRTANGNGLGLSFRTCGCTGSWWQHKPGQLS